MSNQGNFVRYRSAFKMLCEIANLRQPEYKYTFFPKDKNKCDLTNDYRTFYIIQIPLHI